MKRINESKRILATCRRFQFEFIKFVGIFWLVDKISFFRIKEPWNKMYKRKKKLSKKP
jgi:hypothetical protein